MYICATLKPSNTMASKTITINDFSFSLLGWDFVTQLEIWNNPITDNYEVKKIEFEGSKLFDLDCLIEHIEQNLQDELYAEYQKQYQD